MKKIFLGLLTLLCLSLISCAVDEGQIIINNDTEIVYNYIKIGDPGDDDNMIDQSIKDFGNSNGDESKYLECTVETGDYLIYLGIQKEDSKNQYDWYEYKEKVDVEADDKIIIKASDFSLVDNPEI